MSLHVAMVVTELFLVTLDLPVQLVHERVHGSVHSGAGRVGMQLPSGNVHSGFGALGPISGLESDVHIRDVVKMSLELLQLGRNVASQPLADIEMLTAYVHLHGVTGLSWFGREEALFRERRRE
jgi:hypothetical protein